MKKNTHLEIPEGEKETPQVVRKEISVMLIIIIVLLTSVILVLVLYFAFFNKQQNRTERQAIAVHSSIPKIKVLPTQDSEVTKDTLVAKSLDVPPLDSSTQWVDITNSEKSMKNNSNYIDAFTHNDDYVTVSFVNGKYWKSQTPVEYDAIDKYYSDALEKLGWGKSIQFGNFRLNGLSAGMRCQGGEGFVGFKDGRVRTIIVNYKTTVCPPLGSADATPLPSDFKIYADYTVFISDPMSLKDITAKITNH